MTNSNSVTTLSRRHLLAAAGTGIGAMAAGSLLRADTGQRDDAVFKQIENIVQAQGRFSNGVYQIKIERKDIRNAMLGGVPIKPGFEVKGELYFQQLSGNNWIMNADFPLKENEVDPFIDALLSHDIVFQAEHQHFYDFSPAVWFIHFRQEAAPERIAQNVKAALNATAAPFPQSPASNPTTPLPSKEIGRILGGSPDVGSDGIVSLDIPRMEDIHVGGTSVSPYLNIATSINFQPHGGGQNAAASIDFAMTASEINPLMRLMRKQGWDIGCLYNQETDEQPQLYFSHQFKTGDAAQLAKEMRAGLNTTKAKFIS